MADQWIHRWSVPDKVTVLFAGGIEPSVEFLSRARSGRYSNVPRQPGISGKLKFGRQHRAFAGRHFKVRDHAEGVDASISATGAVKSRMAGEESGQGSLDFLLYTCAGLLDLPAFVVAAIVGDGEFEFDPIHKSLTTDAHR